MLNAVLNVVWTLAVILQIAASVLMIRRNLHRRFAPFFAYLAVQCVRSVTLFLILRLGHGPASYRLYFQFYWVTEAICGGLCLLVIAGVSQSFLQEYRVLRKIVPVLMISGLFALLAFNIYLTICAPGGESKRLISEILLLNRSVAVMEVGLVLGLFLFSQVMALPWRRDFSFGIILGLSIVAAIDLVAAAFRTEMGSFANSFYAFAERSGYLLAVVTWLVYIFAPREKTGEAVIIEPACDDVGNWNEALTELLQK